MQDSRFATKEEALSPEFWQLNEELLRINSQYNLPNIQKLSSKHFPWFRDLKLEHSFYASRLWEYPFCILAADLQKNMKCADIGCGTTPFLYYLVEQVGAKNVTGFDPEIIDQGEKAFGTAKNIIDELGIHFYPDSMTKMSDPDNYFDRVFCISVLEHIDDYNIQLKGIREMSRILKPGGRLILTMDLSINNPLTDPLNMIRWSGLTPIGKVNLRWPDKRFINYADNTGDVFGLALEKSVKALDKDYEGETKTIEHLVNQTHANVAEICSVNYSEGLAIQDLRKSKLKTLLKILFNKY